MSFSVYYRINQNVVSDLEAIAQANGLLQVLRMNPQWAGILEHEARIHEAIGSIGVEGTVVSIEEAKAITGGDRKTIIGERERREYIGYYQSLQFIKERQGEPLTKRLILEIHQLLTKGEKDADPGRIRNQQNHVKSNGKIIFTPPPADQVEFLLNEFIAWFNNTINDRAVSPVIAAAVCHFWFVWIHPFMDGNGRTSRVLTSLILLKSGSEGIRYFALSDYYNRNKDQYYDALEKSNRCNPREPVMNYSGDLSAWLEFFVRSYLRQMDGIREKTNRILQLNIRVAHLRTEGWISEKHEKILAFLSSREKASYEELSEEFKVSGSRINQLLKPLRDAHILVEDRIGLKKWFSLGAPESDPDESILKVRVKKRSVEKSRKKRKKTVVQGVLPIFSSSK